MVIHKEVNLLVLSYIGQYEYYERKYKVDLADFLIEKGSQRFR